MRENLLEILESEHKLSPRLLQWLTSFLYDRSLFTCVGGSASPTVPVASGVPQGSVLAPTLFIAHINPLFETFKVAFPGYFLQAYADDLALCSPCLPAVGSRCCITTGY